ncbi:GIY-YIG nuclease family protein [Pseudovibrio sp. Ad26]|uniref:GIY-YIG nuclease family protein n=1 Tax=Pseudovibrio sp. Ad26 TaxID=989410 RepID=UPI0007AE596D|nr:GIY-YIG nuclease family protein [Pseudovibrio sp. Ad26]KZL09820.1 hypothetical protein PsAD26_03348 [Pseudovibrio sp. Ad26]
MTTKGRSLELFFVDGRPDGLLVAELFNWTGHVLLVPRTQIKQALERTEASYTGIYILLGEQDGEPTAYIGETEDIGQRIRTHDSKKDWWTKAVFVTTADNKLNKAHVRFLEARSYERAASVGRVILDNAQIPQKPQVSEATIANMEGFLENLYMILPALGIDLFVESKRSSAAAEMLREAEGKQLPLSSFASLNEPAVRFILEAKKRGVSATARLENGEFIVEAGSKVVPRWLSEPHNYQKQLEKLQEHGVVSVQGDSAEFMIDYKFSSTSAAAAIALGRAANGTTEWKLLGTNKTYKQWEAEQLAEVSASLEDA